MIKQPKITATPLLHFHNFFSEFIKTSSNGIG